MFCFLRHSLLYLLPSQLAQLENRAETEERDARQAALDEDIRTAGADHTSCLYQPLMFLPVLLPLCTHCLGFRGVYYWSC